MLDPNMERFAGGYARKHNNGRLPDDELQRIVKFHAAGAYVNDDGNPVSELGSPLEDVIKFAIDRVAAPGGGEAPPQKAGPATPVASPSNPYHGYARDDWATMSPESRYAAADTGPATPSWKKSVPVLNDAQCAQAAGLSLADFKALSVERRLEIEATVKGALMKGQRNA